MLNGIDQNNPVTRRGNIRILVEKVRVEGNGVILLTGPSGCGKGEIAKALCKFLSIPEDKHLSMGDILRKTIYKARTESAFKKKLAVSYRISNDVSITDPAKNRSEIVDKACSYMEEMNVFFHHQHDTITQLDWLDFCVSNGLLVPDEWTESIIEALFENSPELRTGILILDGYPRTLTAAQSLLRILSNCKIPIIKVLHLFITKEQMSLRALSRKRMDDTEESLERRYQFYIDKVQPCIDYLKGDLGSEAVTLIDAHQPVFDNDNQINRQASIHQVIVSVMQALGLPGYLLDLERNEIKRKPFQ